jgi:hypothetical protein
MKITRKKRGETRKEGKKNLINRLMTSSLERRVTKTKFQESLFCGTDFSNFPKVGTKLSLLY